MPSDSTPLTKSHSHPPNTEVAEAAPKSSNEKTPDDQHKSSNDPEVASVWKNCAQGIRDQIGDAVWQATFNNTKAVAFSHNSLILKVPTALHKMRIERHYPIIKNAIEKTSPGSTIRIKIDNNLILDSQDQTLPFESSDDSKPYISDQSLHTETSDSTTASDNTGISATHSNSAVPKDRDKNSTTDSGIHNNINQRFTFSQFVIGTSIVLHTQLP